MAHAESRKSFLIKTKRPYIPSLRKISKNEDSRKDSMHLYLSVSEPLTSGLVTLGPPACKVRDYLNPERHWDEHVSSMIAKAVAKAFFSGSFDHALKDLYVRYSWAHSPFRWMRFFQHITTIVKVVILDMAIKEIEYVFMS